VFNFGPSGIITNFSSDNTVNPNIAYYRIVSHTLASKSMCYDNGSNSGVVGIVPVSNDFGEYSYYDNTYNFYMTTLSDQTLYNTIDISIFIEDTQIELQNPAFQLVFQFV